MIAYAAMLLVILFVAMGSVHSSDTRVLLGVVFWAIAVGAIIWQRSHRGGGDDGAS